LLELSKGKPVLTLQNTKLGSGIGIDRSDGKPAVRIGLNADGEVVHKLFDAEGKFVSPGKEERK
jgi:hypothetical protein